MGDELPDLATRAGLRRVRPVGCWDCFRNTETERLASGLKAPGMTDAALR